MVDLSCKRCGSASFVKSGLVRGHQRYRCRDCGCNFTDTPARGKPAAMKAPVEEVGPCCSTPWGTPATA